MIIQNTENYCWPHGISTFTHTKSKFSRNFKPQLPMSMSSGVFKQGLLNLAYRIMPVENKMVFTWFTAVSSRWLPCWKSQCCDVLWWCLTTAGAPKLLRSLLWTSKLIIVSKDGNGFFHLSHLQTCPEACLLLQMLLVAPRKTVFRIISDIPWERWMWM